MRGRGGGEGEVKGEYIRKEGKLGEGREMGGSVEEDGEREGRRNDGW